MMTRLLALLFFVILIECVSARSCRRAREPCSAPTPACACFGEVVSGAVSCGGCGGCGGCGAVRSEALCSCGVGSCGGCYRDAAAPCECGKCGKSGDCGKCSGGASVCECAARLDDPPCGCAAKSFLYFPEVEYPLTCLEMNPFYFTNCWRY